MAWDFETEPEFQKELDWIEKFIRDEVEPLDHVLGNPYDVRDPARPVMLVSLRGTDVRDSDLRHLKSFTPK